MHQATPNMAFFSKDFSAALAEPTSSSGGGYLNPSNIADGGEVRLAILSEAPLEGFEVWFQKHGGGMTKRITPEKPDEDLLAELEASVGGTVAERDGKKAIKRCTAFFVYEYATESVKVFSATQKSLLADIERLTSDPDYADLSQHDLKIQRRGKELETKYFAFMAPTNRKDEKVAKKVFSAWDEACRAGADLEALYDGGNPFGAKS
jgi:hypothetical protein